MNTPSNKPIPQSHATPPIITLTGADERTDVGALVALDAEIGLLYLNPGTKNYRFPRREWILEVAPLLKSVAIHICGKQARARLLAGALDDLVEHAQRIQVNGPLSVADCERLCDRYAGQKSIITQHKPGNEHLLVVARDNHAVLVDASGGRGMVPELWVRPKAHKKVGFAGGLGPENLVGELPKIALIGKENWWIDMERNLRVDDWFSVERARDVIETFKLIVHLPPPWVDPST